MKEFLARLDPSLVDCLPHGAIKQLRIKYQVTRQTMSLWLRGDYGDSKEPIIEEVVRDAVEILEENASEGKLLARKLNRILPKQAKSA